MAEWKDRSGKSQTAKDKSAERKREAESRPDKRITNKTHNDGLGQSGQKPR